MKKCFTLLYLSIITAGLIFVSNGCFRLHKSKEQVFSHHNGIAYFKQRSINYTYEEIDSPPFEIIGKPKVAEIIDVAIDVRIINQNMVNVHVSSSKAGTYFYYNLTSKTGDLIENDYFSIKVKLKENLNESDFDGVYFFRFLNSDKPLPHIPALASPIIPAMYASVPYKTIHLFKEGSIKSQFDSLAKFDSPLQITGIGLKRSDMLNVPIYFQIINSNIACFRWSVNGKTYLDTLNKKRFHKPWELAVDNDCFSLDYTSYIVGSLTPDQIGTDYYFVCGN